MAGLLRCSDVKAVRALCGFEHTMKGNLFNFLCSKCSTLRGDAALEDLFFVLCVFFSEYFLYESATAHMRITLKVKKGFFF